MMDTILDETENNRAIKIDIVNSAKIMSSYKDSDNRSYYKANISYLRDKTGIIKGASALFIHTYDKEGIVIDFADWNHVRFYDVRADKTDKTDKWFMGDYYIVKETSFSANRGVPRLNRVFSINGKKIGRVEFYKAELMFLGAIVHTRKVLDYIYRTRICELEINNPELDTSDMKIDRFISGYEVIEELERSLQKEWKNTSTNAVKYMIKSKASKDTNSLSEIALVSKAINKLEIRITDGPGLIEGYIKNAFDKKRWDFNIRVKK